MIDRSRRALARLLLALGVLAGLSSLVATLLHKPEQLALASDVYFHAARALLDGGDIYAATAPERPGYYYLYPPIVAVGFLPHAALGSELAAFALQTAANVAASVGIAAVLWRALERRGVDVTRLDRALLFAFPLVSAHGVVPLINGQVTHLLAFAFAVGFDALDRGLERRAGAVFGAAALVKVFPAAVGLWLLRQRSLRAVGVAVGVGVGGLVLGALALGTDLTTTYLTEVLFGRYENKAFDVPPDPWRTAGGVRRQLAALLGVGPPLLTLLAFAVLAPFVAISYRRVDTDVRRQAAALGTILATLMFLPLQPLYFLLLAYPFVLLLYRLRPGRARAVFVAGALFTYFVSGLESVAFTVSALALPTGIESGVLRVAEAAFTVMLPAGLGMWLLLIACVLVQVRDDPSPARSTPPPGGDVDP